jgi:hypothetical protein
MSTTDYLLNGLLIGLVFLQLRGRQVTARSFILPIAIVAYVANTYLHGIPTAGNDLVLVIGGAAIGAILGIGCGLFTSVKAREDGAIISKAGGIAAGLWILGVGSRLAFELYALHGGGASVVRFSASHDITSENAWTACLVLMGIAEVAARSSIIAVRAHAVHTSRASGSNASQVTPVSSMIGASD